MESQLTTLIREESFEQPLEAAAKIEFAQITEVAAEVVEDEDETSSERN
jgi:hypothetical protein